MEIGVGNVLICGTAQPHGDKIKGIGGFTEKDVSLLYTILDRRELIKLKNYIIELDKRAFITVGEVHEVMGEGFKDIHED